MMTVYRIGESEDENNFYVTDEAGVNDWKRYLGQDLPVQKIEAPILYIPTTDVSFSSWEELQSIINDNPELEKHIFTEESGMQHAIQFEVRK